MINDIAYICIHILIFQDLHKRKPEQFPSPIIQGMLQFDWDIFIDSKRKVCKELTFYYFLNICNLQSFPIYLVTNIINDFTWVL